MTSSLLGMTIELSISLYYLFDQVHLRVSWDATSFLRRCWGLKISTFLVLILLFYLVSDNNLVLILIL